MTPRALAALLLVIVGGVLAPRWAHANSGLGGLAQLFFFLLIIEGVQIVLVLAALISAFVAKRSRAPFVLSIIALIYSALCALIGLWLFSAGGALVVSGLVSVLMLGLSIVALLRARRIGRAATPR